MHKNDKIYKGIVPAMPSHKIYLNINQLQDGEYELRIINKNKLIKKTRFKNELNENTHQIIRAVINSHYCWVQ